VPVEQTETPKVDNWFFGTTGGGSWVNNPIDNFIYQRMREEKLKPSAEADRATLLRRVSLDITGLPASQSLANFF
jgi:hypothetical protein